MQILVVEDEEIALNGLCDIVKKIEPTATVSAHRTVKAALEAFKAEPADIAILDINLGTVSGVDLARQLKGINPKVNIIFATGYGEYTGDAMKLHASGYIMKPVTEEKLRRELADLRHPVERETGETLVIRAFGDFEVFFAGTPVDFKYRKTKEMLAYMVDRKGALCTPNMLRTILWEDEDGEKKKSYLRNLRQDLLFALRQIGCSDAVISRGVDLAINPGRVECDYFRYLSGDVTGINAYRGEYMSQYSWAEMTNGMLMDGAFPGDQ